MLFNPWPAFWDDKLNLIKWTRRLLWSGLILLTLGTAACTVVPTAPPATLTPVLPADTATPSPTVTRLPPSPTPTRVLPSATPAPTPLPLATFSTTRLLKDVLPASYIPDACQALKLRWDDQRSAPGTVVAVMMFHSITKAGSPIASDDYISISEENFARFMERAHQLGFNTITPKQLAGFLEENLKIPQRSLLIIVDDRKTPEFFPTHFLPYFKKWGWKVTNAWIGDDTLAPYYWKDNAKLVADGWLNVQAHGVIHNTPIEADSTDEFIRNEIVTPIAAIEKLFGAKPDAMVWPRGRFTPKAVGVARQAGYRLGFTANPNGPLLFNWIPLKAEERAANDPLMVLPRYWSPAAISNLDQAVQISQEAVSFAEKNQAAEKNWVAYFCQGGG